MKATLASRLASATVLAVLTVSCGGGPREPVAAPVPVREVGAFVVRLGADTVAVEEFARTAGRLEGRQLVRTPRTQLREYVATLGADGAMERFEIELRDAPGTPPTTRATIAFGADTALVSLTREGAEQTFRVPAPRGSIPFLGYSLALYELPFAYLRAQGADSLRAAMVPIGGTSPMPLVVWQDGEDSLVVRNIAGDNRARVDQDGRLLAWDGRGTTLDLAADRMVAVDIERMAGEFAARDAAGRGLGALSPRDSVAAQVGGATISIAYGRPATRGRQIFGNVVPWGQVWRTGANQATVLRTDRDLVIGDTPVPAGAYSLYSIPSATGWQLIVNRNTGQWGTQYDPEHDLARISMQRQTLAEPAEQLTIAVVPAEGDRGTLRIAWDDTQASVPIRVR